MYDPFSSIHDSWKLKTASYGRDGDNLMRSNYSYYFLLSRPSNKHGNKIPNIFSHQNHFPSHNWFTKHRLLILIRQSNKKKFSTLYDIKILLKMSGINISNLLRKRYYQIGNRMGLLITVWCQICAKWVHKLDTCDAALRSELFSTKLSNFSPRASTLSIVLCCNKERNTYEPRDKCLFSLSLFFFLIRKRTLYWYEMNIFFFKKKRTRYPKEKKKQRKITIDEKMTERIK